MSFRRLVRELHRRSVWQVGAVFIGAGWVALQVAELLTESAGLPAWFPTFALGLLVLGLPFVLVTAFLQEGLPEEGAGGGEAGRSLGSPDGRPSLEGVFTWRNAVLGAAGAVALAGVVGGGWWFGLLGNRSLPGLDGEPERRSIAVLPFVLMGSESGEGESFAYGMHDELLTRLSQIGSLRVTSRTSVIQYASQPKPIREIGRELGVETVLEGGIQRSGDRVRLNVQLIDAATDEHLWAETYERDFADIFALQANLTREVAEALRAALTPEEERRVGERPTADLAAYELVLEAREFSFLDPDANEVAIALYKRALARDPEYGEALNSLAWRYAYRVASHGFPAEWLDSAMAGARTAQRLGSRPGALNTIGFVQQLRGDLAGASATYREALELSPSAAWLLHNLSVAESQLGQIRHALPHAWRAALLDPKTPFPWWSLALAEHALGRDERANRFLEAALERQPGFYWASFWGAWYGMGDPAAEEEAVRSLDAADAGGLAALIGEIRTHQRRGRLAEAATAARRLLERHPEGSTPMATAAGTAAFALALAGEDEVAAPLLEDLAARENAGAAWEPPLIRAERAMAQLLLGRRAEALATLRGLADAGFLFPTWWTHDPALRELKDDPEFLAIVEEVRERAAQQARAADSAIAALDPLPGIIDPR
ncbi:MAG: hypothetical protein WEA09_03410 [Gemmatimonadota bacterium]